MHINSMYNYARIEMKNMHNATFPLVLHGTIAKSRIDENIYNVMSQLVESNSVCFLYRRFTSQSTAMVMLGHCLHFMGRHDIQQVFENHPSMPKLLIYMDDLKPFFLGRHRPER